MTTEKLARKPKEERSSRIRRIAGARFDRFERLIEQVQFSGKTRTGKQIRTEVMRRTNTPDPEKAKLKIPELIAFDFETSLPKANAASTPNPKYFTMYGRNGEIFVSCKIRSMEHLCDVLMREMFVPELAGCRFVAHNGNKFDAYFVCAALLYSKDFNIRPYLAGDSNFRGAKITHNETGDSWEILDSMSMTGVTKTLDQFTAVFAPDHRKLSGSGPNFDAGEEFDSSNANHVKYAEVDSEGLYHAINKAQSVIFDTFGSGLQPTIGNLGIKLFQRFIPPHVEVFRPSYTPRKIIENYLMRGGFCHLQRQYWGPVWRYDINQAYAAAMRDADLPEGRCMLGKSGRSKYAKCAMYRIRATHPTNIIPFYYTAISDGKRRFSCNEIEETWLTNSETDQLEREGWRVQYLESYVWEGSFSMKEYVDKLEILRHSGPGGAKGAQGEMVKAIGNNSYGKTVENLKGYELCMAAECPDGWSHYYDVESPFQHVWVRLTDKETSNTRAYHQPQIGSFITAHVRMVLRRAILLAPDAFVYADTDGVSFTRPVRELPIDDKKYGCWKIEAENVPYIFIAKKVYCSEDGLVKHCKGMRVKILTIADFVRWFEGAPPIQIALHRSSLIRAMQGAPMFNPVTKTGARTSQSCAVH